LLVPACWASKPLRAALPTVRSEQDAGLALQQNPQNPPQRQRALERDGVSVLSRASGCLQLVFLDPAFESPPA
jgi:hypothetical protein